MLVNLEDYQVKILSDIAESLALSARPLAGGSFTAKLNFEESVLSDMQEISCILDAAVNNMSIQISNVTGFVNINDSTVSFDDAADPSALVSIDMSNNGTAVSMPGVAPALHTHQAADVSGVALAAHTHYFSRCFSETLSYTGTGAALSIALPIPFTIILDSLCAFAINNKGLALKLSVSPGRSVDIPVNFSPAGIICNIFYFGRYSAAV